MKVYLIRHGESVANFEKRHSGWTQVPLTEKGRRDAINAGKLLEGIHFDKVFSSDIARAMETQRLALPDAKVEMIKDVREINVGDLGGLLISDCAEKYGEEYITNRTNYEFGQYGGESYAEFVERVSGFMKRMELLDCERVAVFCHGGVINTFLDLILNQRVDMSKFPCFNGSVSVFEYKDLSWRMLHWNYTEKI